MEKKHQVFGRELRFCVFFPPPLFLQGRAKIDVWRCSESGEVGRWGGGIGDPGSSSIQDRTSCEDDRKEQAGTMGLIQSLSFIRIGSYSFFL